MLPTLLVSDADWLKEAFIKNFTLTVDRNPLLAGGAMDYGLFNLGGERWKYVRTMLSPTFTQGKLKKVGSHLTFLFFKLFCFERSILLLHKIKPYRHSLSKLYCSAITAMGFPCFEASKYRAQ